jgi:uncharacterized membrane protein
VHATQARRPDLLWRGSSGETGLVVGEHPENEGMWMKAQLSGVLEEIRASYWFIPALMSLASMALSILMLWLDQEYADRIPVDAWWLFGGGPEGAREVLSAVVTSMISVTSVVFSITIVALTLAAGQFGSRILRSFMRDRGNQITLGTFIATFIYAILVLRTIRGPEEEDFVPPLAMSVGVLLTFVSVGVLIFFIHHIARSIQADEVIDAVARETHEAIERIYPDRIGHGRPSRLEDPHALLPGDFDERAWPVHAPRENYLQVVDDERIMKVAHERDLVVRLRARPGDFVLQDGVLADVWSPRFDGEERDRAIEEVKEVFVFGRTRTLKQDAEFGILQLVEIAVRSLSTGINDPFTAMTCADRLASILRRLAGRDFPEATRFDDEGRLRVLVRANSYAELVDVAFQQLRQNGSGSAAVLVRLLEGIRSIAEEATTGEQRAALRRQAKLILDTGLRSVPADEDRADLRRHHAEVVRALLGPA